MKKVKHILLISWQRLYFIAFVRVSIFFSQGQSQEDEFDRKYGFMLKYGITNITDYQNVKNYYQNLSPQERAEKGV